MRITHDEGRAAFVAGLDSFVAAAGGLSDRELMAASRCTGWTAVDVVVHVHHGLQEMLLDLLRRTDEAPTTDAAGYWRTTPPTNDEDADDLDAMRFVRLVGAAYRRPTGAVRHLRPTAEGLRAAVTASPPGNVCFQGNVMTSGDFLTTWAVELAVHQLDLAQGPAPAASALGLARRTVEALAGGAFPADWSDETVVLLGTGRVTPDAGQRERALVAKLPVLS